MEKPFVIVTTREEAIDVGGEMKDMIQFVDSTKKISKNKKSGQASSGKKQSAKKRSGSGAKESDSKRVKLGDITAIESREVQPAYSSPSSDGDASN
jgi:hypothetical protein